MMEYWKDGMLENKKTEEEKAITKTRKGENRKEEGFI